MPLLRACRSYALRPCGSSMSKYILQRSWASFQAVFSRLLCQYSHSSSIRCHSSQQTLVLFAFLDISIVLNSSILRIASSIVFSTFLTSKKQSALTWAMSDCRIYCYKLRNECSCWSFISGSCTLRLEGPVFCACCHSRIADCTHLEGLRTRYRFTWVLAVRTTLLIVQHVNRRLSILRFSSSVSVLSLTW